jgi:hypothetical protein
MTAPLTVADLLLLYEAKLSELQAARRSRYQTSRLERFYRRAIERVQGNCGKWRKRR